MTYKHLRIAGASIERGCVTVKYELVEDDIVFDDKAMRIMIVPYLDLCDGEEQIYRLVSIIDDEYFTDADISLPRAYKKLIKQIREFLAENA